VRRHRAGSVSLDPPLVLVCFDAGSRTLTAVRETGRYGVNILRAGQDELARVFASKRVGAEKFAEVSHTDEHGVEAGDHTIGIGAVTALGSSAGEPLLFLRGEYR
jgi:3-hydroxy-9,10-secoandrosta-1,3,5(10)-triene-9,17-dione monooxygenase reductase component